MHSMIRVKPLLCVTILGTLGICVTRVPAQDRQAERSLASLTAEADYLRARLDRVNAEIALAQFLQSAALDLEVINGEVALAESDLKRAEDRLEWSSRMLQKGHVSKAQNLSDKFSRDQKVFAYEQALTKRKVFQEFTMDKTVRGLQEKIEKARSDESAKRTAYEKAGREP